MKKYMMRTNNGITITAIWEEMRGQMSVQIAMLTIGKIVCHIEHSQILDLQNAPWFIIRWPSWYGFSKDVNQYMTLLNETNKMFTILLNNKGLLSMQNWKQL